MKYYTMGALMGFPGFQMSQYLYPWDKRSTR